jgi:hypothetical protein
MRDAVLLGYLRRGFGQHLLDGLRIPVVAAGGADPAPIEGLGEAAQRGDAGGREAADKGQHVLRKGVGLGGIGGGSERRGRGEIGRVAEPAPGGLLGLQRGPGAGGDQGPLFLGQCGVNVEPQEHGREGGESRRS